MSLNIQFITMAAMIGSGLYIGMAVDTFYRFHKRKKRNVLMLYANEILFWVLQGLIIFYILYRINQGEIRFYIWLALLCGFAAYQALFKNIYLMILEKSIAIAVAVIRLIRRLVKWIIIAPILRILKLLLNILTFFSGVVVWILLLPWKIVRQPVKAFVRLIWRMIPENVRIYLVSKSQKYSKIKGIINQWWKKLMNIRR